MEEKDLRLEKPIKRYSNYHNQEIMVISCKVLNTLDLKTERGYRFKFDIEHCDFKTGKMVRSIAYAHLGFYKNHKESIFEVPFYTRCNIIKNKEGYYYEMYSMENVGLINRLFEIRNNILDNNEEQIMDVFHDYYKELNEWIVKPLPLNQALEDFDSPFN